MFYYISQKIKLTENKMENTLNNKRIKCSELNKHIMDIGWDGCNLIQALKNMPDVSSLNIRGNIYDPIKIAIIMRAIKDTKVKCLSFGRITNKNMDSRVVKKLADCLAFSNITTLDLCGCTTGCEGIKYLSEVLKDTCVSHLDLSHNNISDEGLKYLAEGLKSSNVISLYLNHNGITSNGIQYLGDALKYTSLISVDLGGNDNDEEFANRIKDEGVIYLSECLKHSHITNLNLNFNEITNRGAIHLAQHLKDTLITSLSLNCKDIDNYGIRLLTQYLEETQVACIKLGFPYDHLEMRVTEATNRNQTKSSKIKDIFRKLVVHNTQTHEFEFVIPNVTDNFEMAEYLYFIQALRECPQAKGHIFDLIRNNSYCCNYSNIINKINDFVETMPKKYNIFFDNKLPNLVELSDNYDYVSLVKQFENINIPEIVQNLLLHRVLYYVDETSEILHPYIYKMLDKYKMPLYNEQLEPSKKEEIICFFQNHQDIEGAEELIKLLESDSLGEIKNSS